MDAQLHGMRIRAELVSDRSYGGNLTSFGMRGRRPPWIVQSCQISAWTPCIHEEALHLLRICDFQETPKTFVLRRKAVVTRCFLRVCWCGAIIPNLCLGSAPLLPRQTQTLLHGLVWHTQTGSLLLIALTLGTEKMPVCRQPSGWSAKHHCDFVSL